jgi:cellulose synthase/poly-beta-1,6-N-acetylglucosamine synthase-like glycosyltransferase
MDWYYYIAPALILLQLLLSVLVYRNYRYALSKYKKIRPGYRPRTLLIVPCKGLDSAFQKNITSLFNQDYENYLLWFVVADKSDPAYDELCKLKNQLSQNSKAHNVQVLAAGQGQTCSQKLHNLLYCYERIDDDVEVMAFADSDACVRSDWLSHIVYPLRQPKNGAASGYRWFVPKKNNLASLALSAVNAKIAQLLGNTRFNQAWGGSMAIRVDIFRQLALDKIWPKALSDDLSLSYAVKKAGMKVAFVPACLVASYEYTTWSKLFEFGRRQFLITRISAPRTWWFGLCSSLYSVLGLWAGAALAVYAATIGEKNLPLFTAVPILFFASQMSRAILRQRMISKLLNYDWPKMKAACAADILFFWIWSLLLLFFIISSAIGRTIQWRGIRYKLLGPTETIVVGRSQ